MSFDSSSPSVPYPQTESRFRRRAILLTCWHCFLVAAMAFGSYFLVSRFLLQSVKVVGISMMPNLKDADRYLLNRWIYFVRSPQRADIVVLRDPADNGLSVKRVVAIPGDSVYLKGGDVYLNGKRLAEPYLSPGTPTFTAVNPRNQLILCGKSQVFVLGDNRMNSVDSRVYGAVPLKNILGLIIK